MTSRKTFIYSHRAKLSWKRFRHGLGVVAGTEDREGGYARHDRDATDYLEMPPSR